MGSFQPFYEFVRYKSLGVKNKGPSKPQPTRKLDQSTLSPIELGPELQLETNAFPFLHCSTYRHP
jgi:hypothetical protein